MSFSLLKTGEKRVRATTARLFARRTLANIIRLVTLVCVFRTGLLPLSAQHNQRSASELLQHALYLADLFNWADAGPEFSQAEKAFVAAGDQRNALYAKLGRIRSTVEQGRLPVVSAQLDEELRTNPLFVNDKQLRMFSSL
jgi:hypothetical protein